LVGLRITTIAGAAEAVADSRTVIVRIVEGIDGARDASGVVVVIDVMRAFTTAAFAFAAGASEIDLVATVEVPMALPGFRMGSDSDAPSCLCRGVNGAPAICWR
jgi:hypothetical protein